MAEYWEPMWKVSYKSEDCNVDEVMDGLDIDRHTPGEVNPDDKLSAAAATGVVPSGDMYDEEDEEKKTDA